ncbi:MAG TPA: serine/threonine-protein kinase [Ktedonobacterales bacterium]
MTSPSRLPLLAKRYGVLARIGLGGTAVVYRCLDQHTSRIVAVKVLRQNGPVIPEAEARFRREARLAAALSHANIVRVLDFGYTPAPVDGHATWLDDPANPVPYLAMEYVFGPSLKVLVRKLGALPFGWVWALGEQMCAALTAAHAQGVVHRDMKPQNVIVMDSPTELTAKLTDFGIARQVGGDLTTLTVTGEILGTPDYLSPEQVIGEPGGPSADIHSLGVVLYELATGRLPFEAENPLAAASLRMMADPPKLTAYRPEVPSALQEVIMVALRREPSERFANAAEMAQGLRWSREVTPSYDKGPQSGWVLQPRPKLPVTSAAERALRSEGTGMLKRPPIIGLGRKATPPAQADVAPPADPTPEDAAPPSAGEHSSHAAH